MKKSALYLLIIGMMGTSIAMAEYCDSSTSEKAGCMQPAVSGDEERVERAVDVLSGAGVRLLAQGDAGRRQLLQLAAGAGKDKMTVKTVSGGEDWSTLSVGSLQTNATTTPPARSEVLAALGELARIDPEGMLYAWFPEQGSVSAFEDTYSLKPAAGRREPFGYVAQLDDFQPEAS